MSLENEPDLLTVPQVMARLNCSRWTLFQLTRSGELHAVWLSPRHGKGKRYSREELQNFIHSKLTQCLPGPGRPRSGQEA